MRMTFTEPKPFSSLTLDEKEKVFEYLKDISLNENKDSAAVNMWSSDWENDPKTLMYVLCKTNLLSDDNGEYYLIFDELGDIACSSGVYKSEFDRTFGLATRLWVRKKYRHLRLGGITILKAVKKWSIEHNCKACGLSFNQYNRNIIAIYKRKGLGVDNKPSLNTDELFYSGIHEVEFPLTIKYTKQWIAYEKLDPSYDFDWESIRSKE